MKKLTSLETGTGGRVLRMAIVLSVAVGLATFAMAQQQKKTRRLGTCGPPPRKNPQRQTSAEGFPPLPLPVTPKSKCRENPWVSVPPIWSTASCWAEVGSGASVAASKEEERSSQEACTAERVEPTKYP